MSGRTLRPRDIEDKPGSKGKGRSMPIKSENELGRTKPSRKKIDPLCENELDVDPWLENDNWSRLFADPALIAIRASKSREEWEIKVTFCIAQMALHIRHVPGHRIPEIMVYFQPTTNGVVHSVGERPYFESQLKALQSELSVGFETVARMFLATQVGKEYMEAFWKAKVQKHKPKWITPEIIDSAITITEIEVCALWTPISMACGSGWFLDEALKAKMVSFVPLMKKQTYWILARFIKALVLTKETGSDLSVETRQEIFLYSSKMDILPGFPAPNGGYPRSHEEWMTISPYYKSVLETDEMKAFMKRYGYMTKAMRVEEEGRVKAAKEALKEQARKDREEREREEREREVERIQKEREIELQTPAEKSASTSDTLSGLSDYDSVIAIEENSSQQHQVISKGALTDLIEVYTQAGAEAKCSMPSTASDGGCKAKELLEMVGVVEGGASASHQTIPSDTEEETTSNSNTSANGDSEDYCSDGEDGNLDDFSTPLVIDAPTQMHEEDFLSCAEEDSIFMAKAQEIQDILDFVGVRTWQPESIRALVLSGPIGISMFGIKLLARMRQEIQRATVLMKSLDNGVLALQQKLKEDREKIRKDLEVWAKCQMETHSDMDGLSSMRKDDLRTKDDEVDGKSGGFFGRSGLETSGGKRRSAYGESHHKRKKKAKAISVNPFETPFRSGTPFKMGNPMGTPAEKSDTMG